MSIWEAKKFEPTVRTAAIRIYSGDPSMNTSYGSLRSNPLYIARFTYVFDDLHDMSGDQMHEASLDGPDENPDMGFMVRFMSRDIAKQLVEDFVSVKDKIECLMIHCKAGEGRSPAVGIALNKVFELGKNTLDMCEEFPNFNTGVYELVVEAGENYLRSLESRV